jgi:hypothetical protein
MATNTYVALDKVTVGTATPSVTFTGINQGYTDLVLVIAGTLDSSSSVYLQVNGDTATNYSRTYLQGNGSSATSGRDSSQNYMALGYLNSTAQGNCTFQLQNYSNATTFKTVLCRAGVADDLTRAMVGLWRSTSAITSILLSPVSGNFATGSTFSLYGISNAGDATPKATGGDVFEDATYWYHTFTMSGNFVPNQSLTCDYLVVAGGGGGGGGNSGGGEGGGGAGGLRSTVDATGGGGTLETALSLTAQTYQVLVGAGGAGIAKGSDSVFSSITSIGGGTRDAGLGDGGSGSGASGNVANQGAGTANQGFAGGTGNVSFAGGTGGGGAGSAGAVTTSSNGSNGGTGVATSISGSSVTYAGGGGGSCSSAGSTGGTGGSSIGGNGAPISGNATNGTINTGSGGGGARNGASQVVGLGGSGIVIVRYAK